ncbi:MAG: AsmA family protein [Caulobacteraceae bacterium]
MTEQPDHGRTFSYDGARAWAAGRSREVIDKVRGFGARLREEGPRVGDRVRARFTRKPTRKETVWALSILTVIIAICAFLILFDWNWLRGPIARYASEKTGRAVRIDGDLKVKLFSFTPEAHVSGLKIGHPKWAGKGDTADISNLHIKVRLAPLFALKIEMPLVELNKPNLVFIRDVDGRATWKLDQSPTAKPTKLPPIANLIIRDGHLRFVDQKKQLVIDGTVNSHEAVSSGGDAGFKLVGKGSIRGEPFRLSVRGGPIVNIRKDRPYSFGASVVAGATRILANGALPRPFDLNYINARVTASGRDLADLYDLLAIPLPNTPPYRLSMRMVRQPDRVELHGLSGRVGDSDLAGEIAVDTRGRKFIKADLRSRRLDFDDMAAIFGARNAAGGGQTYRPAMSGGRMLPDATLKVDRMRSVDAVVRYRATSVRTRRIPLRQVSVHAKLNNGVLVADPVNFAFPQGRIDGRARIDARKAVPFSEVEANVRGIRVEYFARPVKGSVPIEAPMSAYIKLAGSGASVHQAASHASGAININLAQGRMRKAFAELMAINILPGLPELLNNDRKETTLSCAAAHFTVRDGIGHAARLVADTDVVAVRGAGVINLANETLDVRLKGKSKKIRILRIIAPIHITGKLYAPKAKAELAKALPQAGIAVALGALVSPLAAVIPFISAGSAKDIGCGPQVVKAAR